MSAEEKVPTCCLAVLRLQPKDLDSITGLGAHESVPLQGQVAFALLQRPLFPPELPPLSFSGLPRGRKEAHFGSSFQEHLRDWPLPDKVQRSDRLGAEPQNGP